MRTRCHRIVDSVARPGFLCVYLAKTPKPHEASASNPGVNFRHNLSLLFFFPVSPSSSPAINRRSIQEGNLYANEIWNPDLWASITRERIQNQEIISPISSGCFLSLIKRQTYWLYSCLFLGKVKTKWCDPYFLGKTLRLRISLHYEIFSLRILYITIKIWTKLMIE